MPEKQEKVFAKGIYWDDKHPNAPEFVVGKLSFKVADAIAFLQEHVKNSGYVNCDVKRGQNGKVYIELNTFMPGKPKILEENTIEYPQEEINPDDIPFS